MNDIVVLTLELWKNLDGTFGLYYQDNLNGRDVRYVIKSDGVYQQDEVTRIDDFPAELSELFKRVQGQMDALDRGCQQEKDEIAELKKKIEQLRADLESRLPADFSQFDC